MTSSSSSLRGYSPSASSSAVPETITSSFTNMFVRRLGEGGGVCDPGGGGVVMPLYDNIFGGDREQTYDKNTR